MKQISGFPNWIAIHNSKDHTETRHGGIKKEKHLVRKVRPKLPSFPQIYDVHDFSKFMIQYG